MRMSMSTFLRETSNPSSSAVGAPSTQLPPPQRGGSTAAAVGSATSPSAVTPVGAAAVLRPATGVAPGAPQPSASTTQSATVLTHARDHGRAPPISLYGLPGSAFGPAVPPVPSATLGAAAVVTTSALVGGAAATMGPPPSAAHPSSSSSWAGGGGNAAPPPPLTARLPSAGTERSSSFVPHPPTGSAMTPRGPATSTSVAALAQPAPYSTAGAPVGTRTATGAVPPPLLGGYYRGSSAPHQRSVAVPAPPAGSAMAPSSSALPPDVGGPPASDVAAVVTGHPPGAMGVVDIGSATSHPHNLANPATTTTSNHSSNATNASAVQGNPRHGRLGYGLDLTALLATLESNSASGQLTSRAIALVGGSGGAAPGNVAQSAAAPGPQNGVTSNILAHGNYNASATHPPPGGGGHGMTQVSSIVSAASGAATARKGSATTQRPQRVMSGRPRVPLGQVGRTTLDEAMTAGAAHQGAGMPTAVPALAVNPISNQTTMTSTLAHHHAGPQGTGPRQGSASTARSSGGTAMPPPPHGSSFVPSSMQPRLGSAATQRLGSTSGHPSHHSSSDMESALCGVRPAAASEDETGGVLSPARALSLYDHALTRYERKEIFDFQEIYFLGAGCTKIDAPIADAPNYGYDDERGDYIVVKGDHVAYRYEILSELGRGSFGQVLKVQDYRRSNVNCALKIIRNKKRFHQQAAIEIRILEHLKAKDPEDRYCTVRMGEHFVFRNHVMLIFDLHAMNLYELTKLNKYQPFPAALIKRFAAQLLVALSFMWRENVVHCDLKPENILLRQENKTGIKVIDFGSSCFETERLYSYIQSRFYRAPEIILGMSYGRPIDIWSLGCILCEMGIGYPVFPGENETDQLLCMMDVLGIPPQRMIDRSPRRKQFFDSLNQPRLVPNSRNKVRRPATKDLRSVLKTEDGDFVDFVGCFLRWDPTDRITPNEAMRHPWILECFQQETSSSSAAPASNSSGGALTQRQGSAAPVRSSAPTGALSSAASSQSDGNSGLVSVRPTASAGYHRAPAHSSSSAVVTDPQQQPASHSGRGLQPQPSNTSSWSGATDGTVEEQRPNESVRAPAMAHGGGGLQATGVGYNGSSSGGGRGGGGLPSLPPPLAPPGGVSTVSGNGGPSSTNAPPPPRRPSAGSTKGGGFHMPGASARGSSAHRQGGGHQHHTHLGTSGGSGSSSDMYL